MDGNGDTWRHTPSSVLSEEGRMVGTCWNQDFSEGEWRECQSLCCLVGSNATEYGVPTVPTTSIDVKECMLPKSWFFQPFWVRSETTWSCDLQEFRWLKFITSTKVRKQLRREPGSILSTFHNAIINIFWVGPWISFLNILIKMALFRHSDGFV